MGICETITNRCEFVITFNAKKGTGKAWVKEIIASRAGYYVPPKDVQISADKCSGKKIYYLLPGTYLVCEEGAREKDFIYKVEVGKDLEMRMIV